MTEATTDPAGTAGMPLPQLGIVVAIVVELLFSILLILGFQTRLVALVMAGFSIATALFFHNNTADTEQLINFMKNVSIAGGFLQIRRLAQSSRRAGEVAGRRSLFRRLDE